MYRPQAVRGKGHSSMASLRLSITLLRVRTALAAVVRRLRRRGIMEPMAAPAAMPRLMPRKKPEPMFITITCPFTGSMRRFHEICPKKNG